MQSELEKQLRDSIDQFELLKPQLRSLKNLISTYISNVQDNLVKRRTTYEQDLSRLKTTESQLQSEIESNISLQKLLLDDLSKEISERDSSSLKAKEMKLQYEELQKQKQEFDGQIKTINKDIEIKLKEINTQRDFINNQASFINDKSYQFEQLLGLKIQTAGSENLIKFIFKNVDPDDFNKEVYFVLDPEISKIVESVPKLDEHLLDEIMLRFSNHKEIGYLWKEIRSELKKNLHMQ